MPSTPKPSNDREQWLRWPSLNPFDDCDTWLKEGLEIGLESARRDRKKLSSGLPNKLFSLVFLLAGKFLSGLSNRPKPIETDNNPYQYPWLPLWPKLQSAPFHDSKPEWTRLLEENYPAIQAELNRLIESDIDFQRAIYDGFKGKPWTAKYFSLFGKRVNETHDLCPITSAVLDSIPHNQMHTCFSCIPAGGALPPHVGPTNTSLVCHLGLVNCEQSTIFAGDSVKNYAEGETLILDDSFIHGAKNSGETPRYTLMFSFWHPDLSRLEIKILQYFYKVFSSMGSEQK